MTAPEMATHCIYARDPSTGENKPLQSWASRSRRWLEWAANGANARGSDDYFWWVGPVPYEMPVTVYRRFPCVECGVMGEPELIYCAPCAEQRSGRYPRNETT